MSVRPDDAIWTGARASLAFAYCRSGKYKAQIPRTENMFFGISIN